MAELDWLQEMVKRTSYPKGVHFKLDDGEIIMRYRRDQSLNVTQPFSKLKTLLNVAEQMHPFELNYSPISLYSDSELLNYLELVLEKSDTGLSFDHIKHSNPNGFRLMRRFHIGEPQPSLRLAISRDMGVR